MTKLKRATINLTMHGFICLMLWLWKGEGIDGAGNLLKAWCAVSLILTLFMVYHHKESDPPIPRALPFGLGLWLAAGEMAALLWFGHWVMVLVLGFTLLMALGMRIQCERHAAAMAARPGGAGQPAPQDTSRDPEGAPRAA